MDEARKVIRRLGRIEALRDGDAPPGELLGELRHLLREGEAWVAAERSNHDRPSGGRSAGAPGEPTVAAAAALESCRALLERRR